MCFAICVSPLVKWLFESFACFSLGIYFVLSFLKLLYILDASCLLDSCFIFLTAAAKSLQSCLTLCDPIDGSLPGSAEELMLLNCGVGEDSLESLGWQGDPTSPPQRRSVLCIHWKD